MWYQEFKIKNFRGIENLTIDLSKSPSQRVFTLVGLNESGKTTILQAINEFTANPDSLDALGIRGYRIEDPHSIIPISKKENFNGEFVLETKIHLSDEDWEIVAKALKRKHKLLLDIKDKKTIRIKHWKSFINSRYDKDNSGTTWHYSISVKTKQAKNWRSLKREEFLTLIRAIKPQFPSILYFPNFLFDFPDKIFIDGVPQGEASSKHEFYCEILQDVLDALDNDLDIDAHIIERAKSENVNDRKALDVLLLKMGRDITKRVFGAWGRIFNRSVTDKKIIPKVGKDESGNLYFKLVVEDNDGIFDINERSLGFQWFFVFLLLTEYRGFRKNASENLLFLFDEPASNLHSTAQSLLLESFQKLSEHCYIIYTTHSHHLINPRWLEGTFVVQNEGIDYENIEDSFNAKKTKITATRYREFAGKHPADTTYFKPILDVLDWAPSNLELVPRAVFVEGKNDFYSLMYLSKCVGAECNFSFLPAMGSGNYSSLIELYLGWGKNFIVLLDSDSEGEKQKERYVEIYGKPLENRIFTLKDINSRWSGKEFEDLIHQTDKNRIMRACGLDDKPTKKILNRCIQEILAAGNYIDLTKQFEQSIIRINNWLSNALDKFDSKEQ